jgi:hypothetical protein
VLRPDRTQILARPWKYLSKFRKDPLHYVRLFLKRKPTARDIAESPRWKELIGSETGRGLLADPAVQAEVERVYGRLDRDLRSAIAAMR